MVYYLEYSPTFEANQGLSEDELLDITDFSDPHEFPKQILLQACEASGKGLYKL